MKWLIKILMALGALCLLVSFTSLPVAKAKNQIAPQAQEADEGFLHPYQGQTFYWTNGAQNGLCHSDGYGIFLANLAGPCSVDFTHYAGGEKVNCGAPAMAPVSGEFQNLGVDDQGNTLGVLKGSRYWILMLHGDFVPSGYLSQGNIIGYENTHGNSTACHWHMDVYDAQANQWVNPTTMQLISSLPSGAGIDVSPAANDQMIQKLIDLPTTNQTFSYKIPSTDTAQQSNVEPAVTVNSTPEDYVLENVPVNGTEYNVRRRELILILVVAIGIIVIASLLTKFPNR